MADLALILHADPPLCFYRGAPPAGYQLAWPRLGPLPYLSRELRIDGGKNGAARLSIDNGDGRITDQILHAPLRTSVTLTEDAAELFTGIITRIRPGPVLELDLEAGSPLRYTDPVPLRTSAAWAEYTEIFTLPHVYGRVTLTPVRYDAGGYLWLLADHPIIGVARVELDGREISAWAVHQATDTSGHAVTVLETQEQIDDPSRLAVTLRGKPHPDTGELLEYPDQVLWDFLANVCGFAFTAADFDDLRSAAGAIPIGGIIDDHTRSIQSWIDAICQGAGLAWAPTAPGVAQLWPAEPQPPTLPGRTLNRQNAPDPIVEADQSDLATVVELAYDYDHARRDHRRTLTLEAPASIEQYGRIEKRIEASWLHDPPAALAYATRWLQYYARPLWRIEATKSRIEINPGESLLIDSPYCPINTATITAIKSRSENDTYTAQAPHGTVPAVELLSTAQGVATEAITAPDYRYTDGKLTLTIADQNGNIMKGATVTLDSTQTRAINATGQVQFTASPGLHTLLISAPGYEDQQIQVTL